MLISVIVKPHARQNAVLEGETGFLVYTTALPEQGNANTSVVELLAAHLKIAKSRVRIKSGLKSSRKIVEIL